MLLLGDRDGPALEPCPPFLPSIRARAVELLTYSALLNHDPILPHLFLLASVLGLRCGGTRSLLRSEHCASAPKHLRLDRPVRRVDVVVLLHPSDVLGESSAWAFLVLGPEEVMRLFFGDRLVTLTTVLSEVETGALVQSHPGHLR